MYGFYVTRNFKNARLDGRIYSDLEYFQFKWH